MIRNILKKGISAKSSRDILSSKVETIRNLLGDTSVIPPNYRGSVAFTKPIPQMITDDIASALTDVCATRALSVETTAGDAGIALDRSKCILCGRCKEIAPDLIAIGNWFSPSVKRRQEMIVTSSVQGQLTEKSVEETGIELKIRLRRTLGRSLAVREVDAGSCNGCEVEITALNNPYYDIERFGIHFVASPRHADVLLVTGPASSNMEIALQRTYKATPEPKIVIAIGACACSGGLFGDTYATTGGVDKVVPVDVYVPGCPPRPQALLSGLLLAVDKLPSKSESRISEEMKK
ncbi:MAG: NADH-quinone oxidoreductase subunit NuoB [Thaumarchaeota archaeon]|nr:NADH-quinone oxidoreductase subunit NuoB [Nitrososphaerota archaeon]MCL5318858.1 NADH-quinone oxidoreductase subunit NuoB [Nitrososphaerota archaeon]